MSVRSYLQVIGGLLFMLNGFELVGQTTQITRSFDLTYSENVRGGVISFGNTSMNAVVSGAPDLNSMNETGNPDNLVGGLGNSQYGNDFSDMKMADMDEDAHTQNSSAAALTLPPGTSTIKMARLYWSGRIDASLVYASPDTLRKIKIKKESADRYLTCTASEVLSTINTDSTSITYQAYADITNFIQVNGEGMYVVADLPLSERDVQGGQYGGWAITVVYENPAYPYYSVRIYDGFATVYNGGNIGSLGFTLNGLNLPSKDVELQDAIMGIVAWEGDANLPGDYVQINGNFVGNARNPVNNFFNGSITRNDTYVSTKIPDYYNQMGIDIDEVYVGKDYGIQPNSTSIEVLLGTERDQYFPGIFTFSVRVKDPTIVINKYVNDQNNNYLDPSEELTFTLSGSNGGKGNSYNTFITDTLPSNIIYVPGSFQVFNASGGAVGTKTDAPDDDEFTVGTLNGKTYLKWNLGIGASAVKGGELPVDSHYLARFKVKAPDRPSNVINLAQIVGESVEGEWLTDQSTASIFVNFSRGTAETQVACDSFYWKGIWYNTSGTYYFEYVNTAGLSAIDTLYLTIKKSSTSLTSISVCPSALPYHWNGLQLTATGVQTVKFINAAGCDSLATLKLTVINCDPPCYTENFNTDPSGWKLSKGAQIRGYENPLNNCRSDRGIITPGVGGFDPAIIQTPYYASSGVKEIKISFDLYPFDANMRCNSWKDYNCPTSIDVNYYVGTTKYVGITDYLLPKNGPGNSPNVMVVIPVASNLPEGAKYAVEIIFKQKNGVGACVQQNTKYVIDNISVCELQCENCPIPPNIVTNVRNEYISNEIFVWPNPSWNILNIKTGNKSPFRIELFDVLGKKVLTVINQSSVNVSKLKAGMYIAKIYKTNLQFESRQIQVIK